MNVAERIHARYVAGRRARVLSRHFSELLPAGARVLDVGCGDGLLAHLIGQRRPDLDVQGVDVLVRGATHIPVGAFDGQTLPHADRSFDAILFADVLHHSADPMQLLREAARVASRAILIKDHLLEGWLARGTLRFMDRVSNARYGVALPYNYWRARQWDEAFAQLGWSVSAWRSQLRLYPWPARLLFERRLHFVARLEPGTASAATGPN